MGGSASMRGLNVTVPPPTNVSRHGSEPVGSVQVRRRGCDPIDIYDSQNLAEQIDQQALRSRRDVVGSPPVPALRKKLGPHARSTRLGPDIESTDGDVMAECSPLFTWHNPDIATLAMPSEARQDDFTLHLTNRTGWKGIGPKLRAFFASETNAGRKYRVKFREDDEPSVIVDLRDRVKY